MLSVKKNNLDRACLLRVLKGKGSHCKGYRKYSKELEGTKLNPTKEYKFIDTNGNIFKTNELTKFAKNSNLCLDCLSRLNTGKTKKYKNLFKYNQQ